MTKFLNISTDNTLGGSSPSDETVSSQKAIKEYVDNNTAPAGSYVTTDTTQTITAAKTFTKAVHFTGTGDTNAVFLTENTRFDIEGTSKTILGMGNSQFYINHSAYALLLRGKNERPSYNSATSYLALLSDVPTVNNPTITFTQGGTTKGTITLNQSGNQTIEFDAGGSGGGAVDSVNGQTGTVVLDAEDVGALPDTTVIPTDTADLTNGAGFITSSALSGYATETWVGQQGYITGITSSDVTTALGYTPYNSTNPSGYQANVIETVKVNGTALTPSSKAVDITVPTNNNQLTNGAGYITSSALSGYQTTITGGATTITSSNLTASRALISNSSGKVAVSDVTSTELGYLDGVTSAIQTQLNNKQAKIGAGTANNIVAYSGTAGTLNTLTRTTSVRAKASASDTYIPTEKAVATSLEDKYDASNPAGYTSNVGTVTSVNNVSPVNGNVTLSIPSEVTETTVSNWGFTKNAGTVTSVNNVQPVNGNVSLSIPTVNNATLTIQKNGTTVKTFTANASSDVTCNITVPTQASDIGAQETLVSGTNIKTINNTTILGSGNISVESLPSQSGQSGKYLTTNGTTASWGIPKTFDLLDWKWSDHELNDQSWLNADTFSWQNGTTYSEAYNHLVADMTLGAGAELKTETIGSYTVSYYLASDGHKIVMPDQETTVSNIYNESGVAWYYVLDQTNQRFKLPRSSHGGIVEKYSSGTDWYRVYADGWCEQGGITTGGSSATKQITFHKAFGNTDYSVVFGNIYSSTSTATPNVKTGTKATTGFTLLDSSTATYQTNWVAMGYCSTYPENTQYKYLYFYVGEYSQSATEQTAGLNSSLFNGKLDLDMGNMNPTSAVKQAIVRWGVPDYDSGVSITSPYTPSVDGIITAQRTGGYSTAEIQITNGPVIVRHASADSSSSNNMVWAIVKAGVSYTITTGGSNHIFYPFIGA